MKLDIYLFFEQKLFYLLNVKIFIFLHFWKQKIIKILIQTSFRTRRNFTIQQILNCYSKADN